MRHDGARALEEARKALEIEPTNEFALSCLGFAYFAVGDHEKEAETQDASGMIRIREWRRDGSAERRD